MNKDWVMGQLRDNRGTVLYAVLKISEGNEVTEKVLPVFNNGDNCLTLTKVSGINGERSIRDELSLSEDATVESAKFTISYPTGQTKISQEIQFSDCDRISWSDDEIDIGLDGQGEHAFVLLDSEGGVIARHCPAHTTEPC